ncbi:acetyltransferase [Propionibacteriaceae bacterium G57]|uniref:acetyltransferase n=1 Tax=Aestuariimicrobium sp. G57 TaxID=3418485 RepID=UPI003DA77853
MSGAQQVVVVGASGFGRESLDVLEAMVSSGAHLEVLGVVDDAPSATNLDRLAGRGVRHLGGLETWIATAAADVQYVLGIGSPAVRARLVARLDEAGREAFTAVHPSATFGAGSEPSQGSVVCAGAAVSTNVRFGRHVHVNPNVTIGHDSELADFVSLNPGSIISGECLIDEQTLVGAGAVVLQQLHVGPRCIIGACACVTRAVPADSIAVGVPARW